MTKSGFQLAPATASMLFSLGKQHGNEYLSLYLLLVSAQGPDGLVKLKQTEIAAAAGLHRGTISAQLNYLADHGWVEAVASTGRGLYYRPRHLAPQDEKRAESAESDPNERPDVTQTTAPHEVRNVAPARHQMSGLRDIRCQVCATSPCQCRAGATSDVAPTRHQVSGLRDITSPKNAQNQGAKNATPYPGFCISQSTSEHSSSKACDVAQARHQGEPGADAAAAAAGDVRVIGEPEGGNSGPDYPNDPDRQDPVANEVRRLLAALSVPLTEPKGLPPGRSVGRGWPTVRMLLANYGAERCLACLREAERQKTANGKKLNAGFAIEAIRSNLASFDPEAAAKATRAAAERIERERDAAQKRRADEERAEQERQRESAEVAALFAAADEQTLRAAIAEATAADEHARERLGSWDGTRDELAKSRFARLKIAPILRAKGVRA